MVGHTNKRAIVNVTGCGFDFDSRSISIDRNIHCHIGNGRAELSSAPQHGMNSEFGRKFATESILMGMERLNTNLSSLFYLHWHVRDTHQNANFRHWILILTPKESCQNIGLSLNVNK